MLDIILNIVRISNELISGCFVNLLDLVFVMLKDIEVEVIRGAT